MTHDTPPPEWTNMTDWSDLPHVYVTKAECQQGMFWRIEACSVPMAIGPEVRLITASEVEAMVAAALRVKPLVWEPASGPDKLCHDHWRAPAFSGDYHMAPDEDSAGGSWLLQWTLRAGDFCMKYGGEITSQDGPEAAKAAAQVDYEARILAALEGGLPQPASAALDKLIAEAVQAERAIWTQAIETYFDATAVEDVELHVAALRAALTTGETDD